MQAASRAWQEHPEMLEAWRDASTIEEDGQNETETLTGKGLSYDEASFRYCLYAHAVFGCCLRR